MIVKTGHSAGMSAQDYSLVGSYKLIGSTRKLLDTGESFDTFGERPNGSIIYNPDGRMMVLIACDKADRSAPQKFVGFTVEQSANLFKTMAAYAGTHEFDGHTVKHHIDISWNEAWTGTTQIRDVQKDGDRLIYTTRPSPWSDGKMSVITVVWQKMN